MANEIVWTKELTLELLCLYEMNQNLYVVKHPDYLDRVKKADSFQMMADNLKHLAANISVELIKRKIHSLRSQFTRDLREVERSKKSGAGLEDVSEPKLWCFNEMLFLKTHCKTRDSTSSYEEKIEGTVQEIHATTSSSVEEDDRFTPKRQAKSSAADCTKRLKKISGLLEEKSATKSPYAWLGKQVVFEIDQMKDENLKRNASWEIQKVLRDFGEKDFAKRSQHDSLPSTSHHNWEENIKMLRKSSSVEPQSTTSSSEGNIPNKKLLNIISVQTIRPASANSHVARSSFTADILEQSMEGVFDENDFL